MFGCSFDLMTRSTKVDGIKREDARFTWCQPLLILKPMTHLYVFVIIFFVLSTLIKYMTRKKSGFVVTNQRRNLWRLFIYCFINLFGLEVNSLSLSLFGEKSFILFTKGEIIIAKITVITHLLVLVYTHGSYI